MQVTVSAPSKIHLSGEHAVVFGKPAILTATSLRLYVTITNSEFRIQNSESQATKPFNYLTISSLRKSDSYFNHITSLVEKKFEKKIPDGFISISSDIPVGCGMGSSAAFAVATIGALQAYNGKPWEINIINTLAFEAEKYRHGNPSGGDTTVIVYGRLLWFRREFEFLKTFWLLPFKISKRFAPFVLVNTGKPVETTAEMVKQLNSEFRIQNSEFNTIFNQIEAITKQMLQAIHDEDENGMRQAIKHNEEYLEQLGVVSKQTQTFIRTLEHKGGVAKISGAGGAKLGSGIVLCHHKDPKVIIKLAEQFKFNIHQVKFGEQGVRIERLIK